MNKENKIYSRCCDSRVKTLWADDFEWQCLDCERRLTMYGVYGFFQGRKLYKS